MMTAFALTFTAHSVFAIGWALILGLLAGGISPWVSIGALTLGYWQGRGFARRLEADSRSWSALEISILFFTMFAAWKHFAWLMPLMPNPNGSTLTTLSATNYGDLPFHLSLIRFLASGADFMPLNPIFATETLRYPFGVDLYGALWECLGIQTAGHLLLYGMAATLATLILLRELGGAWAMAAFFFGGGAVIELVDWKSLFLSVWITQRGFLLALPLGLTLLLYCRRQVGRRFVPTSTLRSMGWMWGLFPIIHAHSFLMVSLLMLFRSALESREAVRSFFMGPALRRAFIPATVLIFHTSAGFEKAGVMHLQWMWTLSAQASLSPWQWILVNFGSGLSVFLIAIGLLVSMRRARVSEISIELLGLLAFWFLGLTVMLAPWDWDNIKVLIWPWVLMFAVIGRELRDETSGEISVGRRRSIQLATWIGIGLAFFPGVEAMLSSWASPKDRSAVVWTLEDISNAEGALISVPKNAVFAAATTPNHVLAYFGRPRVAGYEGHLWSHAIRSDQVISDLNALMNGTEGWVEAARRLKVTHIYWGPDERARFGSGPKPWQTQLTKVSSSNGHEVYALRPSVGE